VKWIDASLVLGYKNEALVARRCTLPTCGNTWAFRLMAGLDKVVRNRLRNYHMIDWIDAQLEVYIYVS
jgi:hypothetical protein